MQWEGDQLTPSPETLTGAIPQVELESVAPNSTCLRILLNFSAEVNQGRKFLRDTLEGSSMDIALSGHPVHS